MPTSEILNSYSVKELRAFISAENVSRFWAKGLKKAEIIAMMLSKDHKQRFHHIKMKGKTDRKPRVVKTKQGGAVKSNAEASAADIAKHSTPAKPCGKTVEFTAKNPPPAHTVKFQAGCGKKEKKPRSAAQLANDKRGAERLKSMNAKRRASAPARAPLPRSASQLANDAKMKAVRPEMVKKITALANKMPAKKLKFKVVGKTTQAEVDAKQRRAKQPKLKPTGKKIKPMIANSSASNTNRVAPDFRAFMSKKQATIANATYGTPTITADATGYLADKSYARRK